MARKNVSHTPKQRLVPARPDSASLNGKTQRLKQFIRVNWLDIVAEEDSPRSYLDSHTPTELLAKKLNSTGYIYKEDDFAIVLCRDEDETNISYLVLPKCVITERKDLYRAEACPVPPLPVKRGKDRKKKSKQTSHRRPRTR